MAKRWQASRVDVRDSTVIQHRTALGRVPREFAQLPVDRIRPAEVAGVVAKLVEDGKARKHP
jgi:hypothetical protein